MTYDGGAETRIAHWVSAVTAILLLMVFGWQICARVILKKS
jgi:Ni,Fe-hydrogenase I cytochrome b subunit